MRISKKTILAGVAFVVAILIVSAGLYLARYSGNQPKPGQGTEGAGSAPGRAQGEDTPTKTVELNETQVKSVKVEPAGERTFVIQREAVGSIDFNQDMTVQVFSPYQGKIVGLFAKLGDEVRQRPEALYDRQPGPRPGRIVPDRCGRSARVDHQNAGARQKTL